MRILEYSRGFLLIRPGLDSLILGWRMLQLDLKGSERYISGICAVGRSAGERYVAGKSKRCVHDEFGEWGADSYELLQIDRLGTEGDKLWD